MKKNNEKKQRKKTLKKTTKKNNEKNNEKKQRKKKRKKLNVKNQWKISENSKKLDKIREIFNLSPIKVPLVFEFGLWFPREVQ